MGRWVFGREGGEIVMEAVVRTCVRVFAMGGDFVETFFFSGASPLSSLLSSN